jgi:hypothetical protein
MTADIALIILIGASSIALLLVNILIYNITERMLDMTIKIYVETRTLSWYTKKTYKVLGGDEWLYDKDKP